jgi:hypothetical protein
MSSAFAPASNVGRHTGPLLSIAPQDESLHGAKQGHGYQASETSYFGFNIPDKAINGEIYVWFHPNLRVCSAGVFIWQGIKIGALEGEYVNYQNYLPYPDGDILNYRLPIGLEVCAHEPLKRIRIAYRDASAATDFELLFSAGRPPVGRPGGGHFTQVMKVEGQLRLRGETHTVDGFFTRDRSWSEERSEEPRAVPARTWFAGIADRDFAFHASAYDDPATAEWASAFPSLAAADRFRWGYLFKDGELIQLTDCINKRTTRAHDGVSPTAYSFDLVASGGRTYHVDGEVKARLPFHMWPNMVTHYSQVQWHMDGRTAWGDAQDIHFADYVRQFARRE